MTMQKTSTSAIVGTAAVVLVAGLWGTACTSSGTGEGSESATSESAPPGNDGATQATPPAAHGPGEELSDEQRAKAEAIGRNEPTSPAREPVDVRLESSAAVGTVVVTFTFEAGTDIPEARVRFVVPDGVELVDGRTTVDMGRVADGEERAVSVVLEVPDEERFQVAAGVDLVMAPGFKMHASDVVQLGAPGGDAVPGDVVETPEDGPNLRMGEAVSTD